MRKGGGHAKGSAFERKMNEKLSLWLSKGSQKDLFTRNVLSGGQFTVHEERGVIKGNPGDASAAHPLAYEFLQHVIVEYKHVRDLELAKLFFDTREKSFFGKVIGKVSKQATRANRRYLIVGMQNYSEPIAILPFDLGRACKPLAFPPRAFFYHMMRNERIMVLPWSSFVLVNPDKLMQWLRNNAIKL